MQPTIPVGPRFSPREIPGGAAAAYVRQGISGRDREETHSVVAVVERDAAECERRIGRYGRVEAVDEGRCRVSMEGVGAHWVVFGLGILEAGFRVEEASPAVREALAGWGERLVSATRPS